MMPSDIQDLIEDTYYVSMADMTEDQIDSYISEFLAPTDTQALKNDLEKVTCGADNGKRITHIRKYISDFSEVYRRIADVQADEEVEEALESASPVTNEGEQETGPPQDTTTDISTTTSDGFEKEARKIFVKGLRPIKFRDVVEFHTNTNENDGKKSLKSAFTLAVTTAKLDDQAKTLAIRFGYYTPPSNSSKKDKDKTKDKAAGSSKPKTVAPVTKPNDTDPTRKPPFVPCKLCGGWHWVNECPSRQTADAQKPATEAEPRYSRRTGTLRADPKKKVPFEANFMSDAEEDEDVGPLKTTAEVNGRKYVFIIDTGAKRTGVSQTIVETMQLPTITGPNRYYLAADDHIFCSNKQALVTLELVLAGKAVRFDAWVDFLPGRRDKVLIACDVLRYLGLLTKDALFISLLKDEVREDDGDDIPMFMAEASRAESVKIEREDLRPAIETILAKTPHLFDDIAPNGANVPPMRSHLKDEGALVQLKPRGLRGPRRAKVREEIKRLRALGITRPSAGPFASPIVVVDKYLTNVDPAQTTRIKSWLAGRG
ncbi:hypothetical protein J8273_8448 [Carpediemonas membranifera]|uniref:Uncharacterized protein n=1 Tax=Carpediemonas membranifera TaxID=201153 RepID=A0A8J6DYZ5_9EUKA|nr:hypothetical protein J8273_8448 [Carpediemonas membranifera]|eukprot:KAG9389771.1 hypothetical protein J8273_8448 [Carpediemonas membranifera]